MKKVDLKQLLTVRQAQAKVFEELEVTKAVERTYRHSLNHLMEWYESQSWSIKNAKPKKPRKPREKKRDYRAASSRLRDANGQLIQDYEYGLGIVKEDEVSPKLKEELEDFKQYRLGLHPLSQGKAVRLVTVEQDLKRIRLMLGWQHHYCDIPTDELTLAGLISSKNLSIANYFHWLTNEQNKEGDSGRGIKSTHTIIGLVQTLKTVAKYLEREAIGEFVNKRYQENSMISTLRKVQRSQLRKLAELVQDQDPNKIQEKEINFYEYLEVTEKLRHECIVYNELENSLEKYSLEIIAHRHQRFILAALPAYVYSHHQRTYRLLEIDKRSDSNSSGYISKNDDEWFLIFPLKFLTSSEPWPKKIELEQEIKLEIPNIKYPDGRCFYDYLEEWLVSYNFSYKDMDKITAPEGLRKFFKPEHNYLFTKGNGKYYDHETDFNRILQNRTANLTKKKMNFSLIAKAFSKYRIEQMDNLKIYSYRYNDFLEDKTMFLNKLHGVIAKKFIANYQTIQNINLLIFILLAQEKLYLQIIKLMKIYPKMNLKKEDFEQLRELITSDSRHIRDFLIIK